MTQIHRSRYSLSPYIDRVWNTENTADGVYVATPDCAWDLMVLKHADGSQQMMIAGQATQAQKVPYKKGTGSIVISFNASVYLVGIKGDELLDNVYFPPNVGPHRFQLLGHTFPIPTYDSVEALVDAMVAAGILKLDEIVEAVLKGEKRAMSDRTMQRHFHKVTGLSRKSLLQIQRAQEAVRLLQAGAPAVTVAAEAGFTDQPHMTKSLKKIMNTGVGGTAHIHKL